MTEYEPIPKHHPTPEAGTSQELGMSGGETSPEEKAPIVIFHETVLALGIYGEVERVDPTRRAIMETYFTSDDSQSSLAREQNMPQSTIQHHIAMGLKQIFMHLPSEIIEKYRSPQEVLRLKSHTWKFTQTGRDNMSQAQRERWKRHREQKAQGIVNGEEYAIVPDLQD